LGFQTQLARSGFGDKVGASVLFPVHLAGQLCQPTRTRTQGQRREAHQRCGLQVLVPVSQRRRIHHQELIDKGLVKLNFFFD
jgi:hypothetical protein